MQKGHGDRSVFEFRVSGLELVQGAPAVPADKPSPWPASDHGHALHISGTGFTLDTPTS